MKVLVVCSESRDPKTQPGPFEKAFDSAWADRFMTCFGQKHSEIADECICAGGCFSDIHDLMWTMWDHCGGHGNPDGWRKFGDPDVRNRLSETLQQAIDLDRDAGSALGDAIAKLP